MLVVKTYRETKGSPLVTRVFDKDTGVELHGIYSAEINLSYADSVLKLTVIDFELDAEFSPEEIEVVLKEKE